MLRIGVHPGAQPLPAPHASGDGTVVAIGPVMVRPPAMLLVLLALVPGLSGCSLIGLGIGSAVTTYETVQPPYERHLAAGDEVRVTVTPQSPSPEPPTATWFSRSTEGKYALVRDDAIVLDAARPEQRAIPLRDVQSIEVFKGSQWKTGLLVGGILDVVAVVLVTAAVIDFRSNFHSPTGF